MDGRVDGYGGLHAVELAYAALRILAGADGFLVRPADLNLRALHRRVAGYVAGSGSIVSHYGRKPVLCLTTTQVNGI